MSMLSVSRILLNQIRQQQNSKSILVPVLLNLEKNFSCQNNDNNNSDGGNKNDKLGLGLGTILIQDGCNIQELPIVFKKIRGQEQFVAFCNNGQTGSDSGTKNDLSENKSLIDSREVINNIEKSHSINGVLAIVTGIRKQDLTPEVCQFALKKILKDEHFLVLKEQEMATDSTLNAMIDCVLSSSDNKILINVLHCFNGQSLVDLSQSIEKLVSEMLLRNVDNKLSIDEICETVKILYQVKQNSAAEKFWLNIKDHEKKITATNIKHVYELLKYVKISRRFILGILERKITDVWFQLSTQDILDILEILNAVDLTPYVSIHSLSRFLYVNIQSVDENSLLKIVNKFKNLSYMDENIQMALEKYCKTKCIKIKNPELLIELLDYCKVNRFRNFHVLNGACEYFILNSKLIKPVHIKKLMDPLGFLDFQPLNATNFWKAIEKYLEQQFTEIPPTDIIDIMLSCCYVEKFPLNFTPKIFNTYFLDLLHSSSPPMKLQKMRQNLKLFDFTMTLECSDYSGPYLPKDHTGKSLWQDGRINRLINNINENLTEIVGSKASFSKSVILYQLPFNELFIIDILYHPAGMLNTWNIKMLQREKNLNVAVLIHLPEHFSADGYLIGPQSMRIRQFRKLGLKVATLKYDALMKLKIHPNELDNYLKERMKLALEAL